MHNLISKAVKRPLDPKPCTPGSSPTLSLNPKPFTLDFRRSLFPVVLDLIRLRAQASQRLWAGADPPGTQNLLRVSIGYCPPSATVG